MCGSTITPAPAGNALRMRGSSVFTPPPNTGVEYSFESASVKNIKSECWDKKDKRVGSPLKSKRRLKTDLKVVIPGKTSSKVSLKDVSMRSQTPGGKTHGKTPKGLAAMQSPHSHRRCPISVGKLYELTDGRLGLCMYLGRTLFNKKGIWVGLQLENAEGKHNGTVDGRKYFLCREGKGIFVRPHRIRRLVTEVSNSHIRDKKVSKDP